MHLQVVISLRELFNLIGNEEELQGSPVSPCPGHHNQKSSSLVLHTANGQLSVKSPAAALAVSPIEIHSPGAIAAARANMANNPRMFHEEIDPIHSIMPSLNCPNIGAPPPADNGKRPPPNNDTPPDAPTKDPNEDNIQEKYKKFTSLLNRVEEKLLDEVSGCATEITKMAVERSRLTMCFESLKQESLNLTKENLKSTKAAASIALQVAELKEKGATQAVFESKMREFDFYSKKLETHKAEIEAKDAEIKLRNLELLEKAELIDKRFAEFEEKLERLEEHARFEKNTAKYDEFMEICRSDLERVINSINFKHPRLRRHSWNWRNFDWRHFKLHH